MVSVTVYDGGDTIGGNKILVLSSCELDLRCEWRCLDRVLMDIVLGL